MLSKLAVYLHISKLVLEENNLVVLGQIGQKAEDGCGLARAEEASEDGDRDGRHEQVT